MNDEKKLGSFKIAAKSVGGEAPDPEKEFKQAVEAALSEYQQDPGEAVPNIEDFELREEKPFGAETLLVVFLTAAATAGGKRFGEKTVDAIWDLVATRLRNSRNARIDVSDKDLA